MKQFIAVAITTATLLAACGGKKETAQSIAQEWCDLNSKVYHASEGEQKEKAKADRKAFEEKMQKKYDKDTAFMAAIGREVEKCEGASEGK